MSIGVRVDCVRFEYPAREVLRGLSFECAKGEFVAILGPNGSGKTTLLKTISGYLAPSKGAVYLEEKQLNLLDTDEIARRLAVVIQSPVFEFPFSVREYVLMGRTPHLGRFQKETPDDHAKAMRAMQQTGVESLSERYVTELSGGEQRRAAIARALAQEPRVLLLDEPTSGLDINYQVSVMALMQSLARSQMAVIAVLHDINLASLYCDSILLMKQGDVYAFGEPASVVTSDNIRDVYGSDIEVSVSARTGRPFLLPVSRTTTERADAPFVFVVAGGGSATSILPRLAEAGLRVVSGVLNAGDADWFSCKTLGLSVVEEQPFSAVSEDAFYRACEVLERCDTLVLARVPFGNGNLLNIELAKRALEMSKKVLVVGLSDISSRDYTGGKAAKMIHDLVNRGAAVVHDEQQLIEAIWGCR